MPRPSSPFALSPEQAIIAELRALRAEVDALKRTRHAPLPGWVLKEVVDGRGRHLGALYAPTGTFTVLADA